jgi:hypothetical protein
MEVNLERGGIIWQARLHMATAANVEPLDEDTGEFQVFASEMTSARVKGTNASQEKIRELYDNLSTESKDYPLGRVARSEQDLPSGKRLNVNLALLYESFGNMPPYTPDNPTVGKIGRANFFLRNAAEHSHPGYDKPRYESILSAGFDILSDGSVNTTVASLEACQECITVQLHDDSRIIGQLGLQALFYNRMPLPEVSSYFGPYTQRTSRINNRMLTADQVTGLQGFLAEQFKPTEE